MRPRPVTRTAAQDELTDAILNHPADLADIADALRVDVDILADALAGRGPDPSAELIARARRHAVHAIRTHWHL